MSEEIVYVQKVRETLLEINYCNKDVAPGQKCDLELLCQECQEKIVNLMEWADDDSSTDVPSEEPEKEELLS